MAPHVRKLANRRSTNPPSSTAFEPPRNPASLSPFAGAATARRPRRHDPWEAEVLPRVREVPRKWLAKKVGVSERTVSAWRQGRGRPRARILDHVRQLFVEKTATE